MRVPDPSRTWLFRLIAAMEFDGGSNNAPGAEDYDRALVRLRLPAFLGHRQN